MKKRFALIIIFLLFIIIRISSSIFLKKDYNNYLEDKDNFKKINSILTEKKEKKSNIYTDNINNKNIKIDTNIQNDNLLGNKKINLTENYLLIELLYGKNNDLKYLNDESLLHYNDLYNNYYKIWYLYDINKDVSYEILNTDGEFLMFINPYIENNNFLFDDISKAETQNHYTINIKEFITKIISGDIFDYYNYMSTTKDFVIDEANKTYTTKMMINNNNININLYEKHDNSNINYSGFVLEFNGIKESIKMDFPNSKIGKINLTNDIEGIILTNYDTGIDDYQTKIYTYLNNKFILVFSNESKINEFIFNSDLKDINIINLNKKSNSEIIKENLISNNLFYLTFEQNDLVQSWTIIKKFKLNENYQLELINEKYYEANEIITSVSNQAIYLYKDKDLNSEQFLLEKNSEVKFIGTDLKSWIAIMYKNEVYYLKVDKYGNILDLDIPPIDIFPDLIYGD